MGSGREKAERKGETRMVRRHIKLCVALLTVVALLGGMLAVIPAIAADTVTETILEDFEDAAHVANWHQIGRASCRERVSWTV